MNSFLSQSVSNRIQLKRRILRAVDVLVYLVFVCFLFGTGIVERNALAQPLQVSCPQQNREETGNEYKKAMDMISHLPEFRGWSRKLPSESQVAFGGPLDKKVVLNKKCVWLISVYESTATHQAVWQRFQIHLASKQVRVMDADGNFVAIKKWRAANSNVSNAN